MRRVFSDLHLRINCRDGTQTLKVAQKAAELGYKQIATPLAPETRPEQIRQLQATFGETGVDFVSRVDLRPRSQADLLSALRKLRRKFEVICVLCENKEVARQAAKDRRVDLLNFPLLDFKRRFFDFAEAELASSAQAGFEVDVKPLLVLEGPARVRLLSSLRREVAVALEYHVPVVACSGVSELLLMRRPREVALLLSLFGLQGEPALNTVSVNPAALVCRNREKLAEGFVAPGIRVVKQGADC
ncbi:MAG: RNase P subunit p30 family protein [Candidatus Bathyarchaeia archaeon]|jgi:RNase P/RNase MRP subunit p30